jgi:putative Mn2+ efflux pump MntP
MILFGIAEVVTGFTHEFLGISTSQAIASTYASATIGACYILAGFLILTLKKWAAALAIVLLGADVVGRITLVLIGFYPVNSLENAISIFAGTIIAVIFAIYVGSKWNSFR